MTTGEHLKNDPYQRTLEKVMLLKPVLNIQRLLDVFIPHAKRVEHNHVRRFNSSKPEIYLLTDGFFSLHRELDDLQLCIARAPHIFGFAEVLLPSLSTTCVRFSQGSEVFAITGESTFKILEQHPELWIDVATLLGFHMQFSSWRDLHLLNESAYISIRGKLLELETQPPELRHKETILNYILASTKLSRSTVLRVLKDLNDGGYIEMHKGSLIKINNLPLRY